ncbi:MAG: NUDIX domain-containing protein [bacterium]
MSTKIAEKCPHCGKSIERFRNPTLTVDIIIEVRSPGGEKGIVLVQRKNFPFGWAIPGGFVDYGETLEAAAIREAKEETSLDVKLKRVLGVYSDPQRDPRGHTVSVAYVAESQGHPVAGDDAGELRIFAQENLPTNLAFDHAKILEDYFQSTV